MSARPTLCKLKIPCLSPGISVQLYWFNFYKSNVLLLLTSLHKTAHDWCLSHWFFARQVPVLESLVASLLITYQHKADRSKTSFKIQDVACITYINVNSEAFVAQCLLTDLPAHHTKHNLILSDSTWHMSDDINKRRTINQTRHCAYF
jgi:hypothetical protein